MKRLLNITEAAEYVGVSVSTLPRVCPVVPVKLGPGHKLTRYDRVKLDEWIESLDGSMTYEDDADILKRFEVNGKSKRH